MRKSIKNALVLTGAFMAVSTLNGCATVNGHVDTLAHESLVASAYQSGVYTPADLEKLQQRGIQVR